jgi:four helix bundle protein
MHFRELKVWQKAHQLTLAVYAASRSWPREETFGLTSQTRRAAVSIEAHLAEGSGRAGRAEFARFSQIALGSARELECELLLAFDLGYIPAETHAVLAAQVDEVQRMLVGLAGKLSPL